MFTGIITALGTVATFGDLECRFNCPAGWLGNTLIGDSIAVNGACLTVTGRGSDYFTCDISAETRHCCAPLAVGARVNLEQALAADGKFGGHIVSGHIDGTARVHSAEQDAGGGINLRISAPAALLPLIAVKGSIALAGVSLTVNHLYDDGFDVYILPHTLAHTNLADYPGGSAINIETDILARHIARLIGQPAPPTPA